MLVLAWDTPRCHTPVDQPGATTVGFAEVTRWLGCLPLLILLPPLLTGVLWEHFPTSGSASEEPNLRQTSDLELIK